MVNDMMKKSLEGRRWDYLKNVNGDKLRGVRTRYCRRCSHPFKTQMVTPKYCEKCTKPRGYQKKHGCAKNMFKGAKTPKD